MTGIFKINNNEIIDSAGKLTTAVFPTGGMFNFRKTVGTVGSVSTPADGAELTIFGSHAHVYKTTDAILVVECVSALGIYNSSSPSANEQRVTVGIRSSADSYASNLTAYTTHLQTPGTANQSMTNTVLYRYVGTPSRSVGDTHTFKIHKIAHTYISALRTSFRGSTGLFWISYEVAV